MALLLAAGYQAHDPLRRGTMPIQQQYPEVLSLLLVVGVHRDGATGKYYLLGTYSTIRAPAFPLQCPAFHVYGELTGGRGQTQVRVRLVDVDEAREPVFEMATVVDFPDPLAVREIAPVCHNVVFPEPGEYRLQVFGAGQFLRERRLFVADLDEDGAPPP
jgi:hypothetical protein